MDKLFYDLINTFRVEKREKYNKDTLTQNNMNLLIKYLDENIAHNKKFCFRGSVAQGRWTDTPWIAYFNTDITNTIKSGYYVVYIISADLKTLYLCLGFGYEHLKETYNSKVAREILANICNIWKEFFKNDYDEENFQDIDLKTNGMRQLGYKSSTFLHIKYDLESLPDSTKMKSDLYKLINSYEVMIAKCQKKYLEKSYDIKQEISLDKIKSRSNDKCKQIVISKGMSIDLKLTEIKPIIEYKNQNSNNSKKTDYIHREERNVLIGLAGEYAVLNYEANKLKKLGINKTPIHMSKETNDSCGYDILSYDKFGKEIYIEVKATSNTENASFYITDNELQFAKENTKKYYLYRVYSMNNEPKFYILNGNDLLNGKFRAVSYTFYNV